MKLGLQIINFDWPTQGASTGRMMGRIASTAESAGFSSLWVMDHFFQMGNVFGEPDAPMLEGYTTLGYLAASTDKASLGTLVTGNIYREPGLLVKTVTTLDVLSGGRAWLGIGAGWYEREARGLGFEFPPTRTRFDQLEETLQIAHRMFDGDQSPYVGDQYALDEPINSPPPVRGRIPVLLGGEGEKRSLRLAAQYADATNFYFGATPPEWPEWHHERFRNRRAELGHKLAVLREHCDAVGRTYEEVEKTVLGTVQIGPGAMSGAEFVELCGDLREIGFDHVIINMPDTHLIDRVEQFAEIESQIAEL